MRNNLIITIPMLIVFVALGVYFGNKRFRLERDRGNPGAQQARVAVHALFGLLYIVLGYVMLKLGILVE